MASRLTLVPSPSRSNPTHRRVFPTSWKRKLGRPPPLSRPPTNRSRSPSRSISAQDWFCPFSSVQVLCRSHLVADLVLRSTLCVRGARSSAFIVVANFAARTVPIGRARIQARLEGDVQAVDSIFLDGGGKAAFGALMEETEPGLLLQAFVILFVFAISRQGQIDRPSLSKSTAAASISPSLKGRPSDLA